MSGKIENLPAILSEIPQQNCTMSSLIDRALMLKAARAFFEEREVLEVDCCALGPRAAIDSNIDVISATVSVTETGFLHTSPEYAMKRLLAGGSGDIYYLGHVFRKGDIGRLHNPEFAMAEWYRLGIPFSEMIEETCDFLSLFFWPSSRPSRQLPRSVRAICRHRLYGRSPLSDKSCGP